MRPHAELRWRRRGHHKLAKISVRCVHAILYRTLSLIRTQELFARTGTPHVCPAPPHMHSMQNDQYSLSLFSQHLSRVAIYLDPRLSERLDHIREPRLHDGRRALRVLE